MTTIDEIKKCLSNTFGTDIVETASVGGSGTFGFDTKNGLGFPEALSCVPSNTVVETFSGLTTPFGYLRVVKILRIGDIPIVRVPYHGWTLPWPKAENILADFWLLSNLGVRQVLADASVGGMNGAAPWDIIIPDDIVPGDINRALATSLSEELAKEAWVRMNKPFCERIRTILIKQAEILKEYGTEEPHHKLGNIIKAGTDYTTQLGPFESAPEIRMIARMVPEVIAVNQSSGLESFCARVCGMCYSVLHIVANYAEGLENAEWNPEPGGMNEFYRQCPLPMSVILWRTLKEIVTCDTAFPCSCQSTACELELTQFS